ncbi:MULTISPECIES: histidine phosphotransferase family protein [unclassified Haematospirillum]|uniref:histidine phosphotransferase family protein n=1 Tax=unclassified Haematospirillum TaxID=2622088 RepID=UPI001FD725D1|nr:MULTISPECIES: histidine phosphotransferase family protein [unclassified Haematospirillum]
MQDADLADLLCTRLCHDLAGPVGAVVAGMELMADEDDPRLARETVALLKGSADAVSSRLRFLRTVFGMSLAGERDLADLATLCDEWIRATKSGITLLWGDDFDRQSTPGYVGRMILCMIMLAADHLVRGGSISVRSGGEHSGRGVVVAATGTQVTLIPDLDDLLSGQPVVPGPRNAPVVLLHQLAMRAEWRLSHAFSKREITLCATPMRL